MNVQPKIWNSNSTNTEIHVFLNGQARCGSNDKQNKSPMHTLEDGQTFVQHSHGLTFCKDCESDFLKAEKRNAAKRARQIAKLNAPLLPQDTSWRTATKVPAPGRRKAHA